MSVVAKFIRLLDLQELSRATYALNAPISNVEMERIAELLGEGPPEAFAALYKFANGQPFDPEGGVLFGWHFSDSAEIIRTLEFSRSLIKPERPRIEDPAISNLLIEKVVDYFVGLIAQNGFGKRGWFKVEFSCSPDSVGGPYVYPNEDTGIGDRKVLQVDVVAFEKGLEFVKELHQLEKHTYNWDEVEFVVYSDGKYEIKRGMWDFDNHIPFSSTPENAIKLKYFHVKWLPIFSDLGGNYVGIDLDPGTEGVKGQVINFGRDEEDMFVLADTLESFFDKLLDQAAMPDSRADRSDISLRRLLRAIAS